MIGTGYVGLVSGTCLAEIGHTVTCVDVNEDKISSLNNGISPIYEPGLERLIQRNVEHERLSFTCDISKSVKDVDCVFIAVGTPEGEDGSCDLQYVQAAAKSIGESLQKDTLIVTKSTVPVGTGDLVQETIEKELIKANKNLNFAVASNPEFLKEGDAISDFMKPERIVIGVSNDWSEKILRELYKPFVVVDPGRLLVMDRRSSELTKYASNSMLATRISFMNELSQLCEKVGANIDSIRRGMGSDFRIGRKFLYAGPGFGGSCFPKDVTALLKTGEQTDIRLSVLNAVMDANNYQKKRVSHKIIEHLDDIKGKRIALWGLAFKPGTDDVRETPAKTIIETLLSHGATVVAHDPEAMSTFQRCFGDELKIEYVKKPYDLLEDADALVLVTEWSEYRQPNWKKVKSLMKGDVVFDFRNQYITIDLATEGLKRIAIGQ